MNQIDYTVNGKAFGSFFGDANRYAMRQASMTGKRQVVLCNGRHIVSYVRGQSGKAQLIEG